MYAAVLQLQVDCKEQLELFHSSVIHTNFNELGHALLYSDLPVTPLLLLLNGHIMSLLRLVLLEGRILLYSRSCAVVSTAVYALAMLLPGCLPLGFSSTNATTSTGTTARNGASPHAAAAAAASATAAAVHPAFSARAYRWRKYGLPLQTFWSNASASSSGSGGCRLEPLLVMAEAEAVLACSGFLAGTTNAMISSLPGAALDCFVNLDDGTVRTARTPLARAAFTPGADDRAFVQSLVAATRASTAHTSDTNTSADASSSSKGLKIHKHSGSVDWEGSGPWAADQVQLFFEEMLVRAAGAIAQAQQQADSSSNSNSSSSSAAAESKAGTNGSAATANTSSNRRANSSGSGWGFDAMLSTAAWLTGTATTGNTDSNNSSSSSSSDALVQAALAEYGRDWAAHWLRTHNYKHWCSVQSVPQEELALRPRHKRVLASIGSSSSSNSGGSSDAVDSPKKQQACPQSGCHTYSYPTGDVYIGEFVKGRREGRGHYVEHSTGNTYEGEWLR
jgi:Transport protein Avl9